MNNIGSPSNIEVLLWCHTRCEPHPRFEVPAVQEALEAFVKVGAIEMEGQSAKGSVFGTTKLGKAWVQALCNVPPPLQVYADEQGRILTA